MVNAGKYMYLAGLTKLAVYNFFKRDFAMTRPACHEQDIGEQHDLAEKYPDKIKELTKLLNSIKMKNSKEMRISASPIE